MNNVVLMGRLTRNPDVRYSQGENSMAVARFTLAVDRAYSRKKDENSTDFISCVAFGKTAEFAEKYLKQGTKIALSGRIQTGSYTNKDGNKVYTTDVVAENVEFAESKNAAGGSDNGGYNGGNGGYSNGNSGSGNGGYNDYNNAPAKEAPAGFMNIPTGLEEELPFN